MAIERNAAASGKFLDKPGEYKVKVSEVKTGVTKEKKDPMLTVKFETSEELSIKSYFVKKITFHMKALEALKLACGLTAVSPAEDLVGKECGILVEMKEGKTGQQFSNIVGYGPVSSIVVASPSSTAVPADEIPF